MRVHGNANDTIETGVLKMKRLFLIIVSFLLITPAYANGSRSSLERHAEAAARRNQVPVEALKAICERESSWNPKALGQAGEIGLCQLRPQTVAQMKGPNWRRDLKDQDRIKLIETELYDPAKNLEWAAKYLRWMMREAKGDITLAIAAYNAGPGVIRYVNRVKDSMGDYGEPGGGFLPVVDWSRTSSMD